MPNDKSSSRGMFAAAAAFVGLLFAAGSTTPQRASSGAPRGQGTSEDAVGGDAPSLNLDHVSMIYESSRVTPRGTRGTIVVLQNGKKLEGSRPYDSFGAPWPRFILSVMDGQGPRNVLVNPSQVTEVVKSTFRRTNMPRPDTVVLTVGGSVVVRESIDVVKNALGRGGSS